MLFKELKIYISSKIHHIGDGDGDGSGHQNNQIKNNGISHQLRLSSLNLIYDKKVWTNSENDSAKFFLTEF